MKLFLRLAYGNAPLELEGDKLIPCFKKINIWLLSGKKKKSLFDISCLKKN